VIVSGVLMFLQKISGGSLGVVVDTGLPARFSTDNRELYRPGGLFWDANLSSSMLMYFGILATFLYLKNSEIVDKKLLFTTIIASLIGIILSLSRGVWLVLFLNFLFLVSSIEKSVQKFFKKNKFNLKNSRKLLLAIIAPFIVLFSVFVRFVVDHFARLFINFNDSTALSRIRQLEMSWHYMVEKPLGLGHNVFKFLIIHDFSPVIFFNNPASAHNLLLEILNAIGFLGLLTFIALILFFLKYFLKEQKKSKKDVELLALLLAGFNYVLVAQFYPWLYEFQITAFFWIIIGMAYAKIQKNNY
jgi:O-antigen ligase